MLNKDTIAIQLVREALLQSCATTGAMHEVLQKVGIDPALLDAPQLDAATFASLRETISGGAPLPLPLKRGFEQRTGVKVIEGYGLTETNAARTEAMIVSSDPAVEAQFKEAIPATSARICGNAAPFMPSETRVVTP